MTGRGYHDSHLLRERHAFRTRQAYHVDISPHLHQALLRIYRETIAARPQDVKRETEVIKWMMEGKTNWEIGVILNIGERTLNSVQIEKVPSIKAHAIAMLWIKIW